ncbi:hypothetical protein R3P38DRAFT_2662169 [Favolaschia claudopus]|uniref:Uncharacterized protein n=1 Tax=Favolaschia claudopus TaxID=2862362 RepID=A0AAV9ZK75_9AGAR
MAHLFPITSGPNDPQPPPLSAEQWNYALRQFQFLYPTPGTIPPPTPTMTPLPPPNIASPVLDPALCAPQPESTESRLDSIERELDLLKTQKRPTQPLDDDAPSKKRRKKKSTNSAVYILKSAAGLSEDQLSVRKELMKMVKTEGRRFNNRLCDSDSSSDDGDDESGSSLSHASLSYKFSATVLDTNNIKIFDRIANLIWSEQHDPKSTTYSLNHPTVSFSRDDLLAFAKTNFRTWKNKWRGETDEDVGKKQAKAAQRDRQELRRKELKANRIKAVPEYKRKYKRDPMCIMETDWMSDEILAPDTDDEDTKAEHRRRLIKAARLGPAQQEGAVWEVVRPGFQSTEMMQVKNDLDKILQDQRDAKKSKSKNRARARIPRVSLSKTHDRIPYGTALYPFMVSPDWYAENIAGNEEFEKDIRMNVADPPGFGDA